MSGNEITGIHNFFEENSSHQSQVAASGHIVSNINPWIGTQAMSRVTPSPDTDSDQGNVRLPFQTPFGVGLSQFGLKQHINRSQSKNQQFNLNELMHVSTALQGISGQGKFQREVAIPDNISLMQRGLTNFGSQEGNSPGFGSSFPGSLEKPDVTASPVSFDFLGGHQQLSAQHPGMSQAHQMQQQGSNEMQWKQHLIAMQMQEMQRQQQFQQQLHLGSRQHNSLNQMYGVTGQGATDELPGMLSGMPVANAVNYMPGELMGSQSKSPNSSHMFIAGNMNWAQRNIPLMQGIPNGLMYSQDQSQSMHSMGFVPRQLDQSLHGTPVSGSVGPLNHYFQLQGMSNNITSIDLMSKLGENHAERTSMQSSSLNDFHNDQRSISNQGYSGASFVAGRPGAQGKTLFGNTLVQGTDGVAVSGNFHQPNHLTESVQVRDVQHRQVQTDWLGKSHDSVTSQVTPAHTATSLDPTEEKILFGVDDNANWDASLGGSSNRVTETYLNGYPIQNNDCLNVFPSLQSGTWSALVQEALEVSSSDTGQLEEWSGLSLQKAEPQAGNDLVLSDNDKQNAVRDAENNLHNTLRSKPFPLSDATARQSCHSVPSSQQSLKYSFEQNERLETDHSIQSVQQLSKETNDAQFAHNYQPYNFIGNSLQEKQRQLNAIIQERQRQLNVPNDVWAVQEHQQGIRHVDSAEMGSNSQGMQHSWIQQQKMPFYNMNSQLSNKLSSWGTESPSSSGSRNLKNDDNGDLNQYTRSSDINTAMHIEMTHARSLEKASESKDAVSLSSLGGSELVKSETNNQKMPGEPSYVANFSDFMNPNTFRSNMVINQQLLNRQTVHPLKHVAGHLFTKDKAADQVDDQKQLSTFPLDWDPSSGYTNKESDEAHGHALSHLNTDHDTDDAQNDRDDSLLARSDHLRLISSGQKFADQSDRKSLGSQRFQFHPMGNLEVNMETVDQESHKSHSQSPSHPTTIWGLKNHEKENFGNSQLVPGHVTSTNSIDMGKDCYIEPKKNSTLADMPHSGTFSGNNPAIPSFSATTAHFLQEKRIGLPSQNVHMLVDKSDQLDDCASVAKQNLSENNSSSGMPEGVASDGTISHLQRIQANHPQGSGLKLVHPSQRQSMLGNPLIMHMPAEGSQAWSSSTTSAVDLSNIHETSRRENLDYKTVMSPQASKDALYSNIKGNSLGMITNIRNQPVQQLQHQGISYSSRQAQFDQSVNQSFGSKVNADGHPKHLHPPQAQDRHDISLANQTSQALFPGIPGKVPASRLASFPDNGAPLPSQFYSQESRNFDMINASSDRRNASQHFQSETISANHPSGASLASQQGHFSNIVNNAWKNAAFQRSSGLQHQKFHSNLLQSMNPLQPPHQDDQRATKGGNASSEVGNCSINSQQFAYGEENPLKGTKLEQKHAMGMGVLPRMASVSDAVQEQESKNISSKNSAVSVSSSVHVHQQDERRGKYENQREKMTFPTVSPSNSDFQTHNYSLLQQMQAMKGTDSDPSIVSRRLKGIDSACRGSDSGSQPSDMKLLSFSSREIEERSGNASNHLLGDLASCRPTSSPFQHELQNGSLSSSVLNLTGKNERHLINTQMAPWFEHYGNYKDSQTSGMSDSLGSSQRSTKAAAQHYLFSKTSEQMDNDALMKRRGDSISENSSPTALAADSHSSPNLKVMVTDESLVPARKKRKIASSDLLSWHKEVTQSSRSLQSFSFSKMEWAQAINRLIEKIEDDTEALDDVPSITRPKKRLILTTQLIQQLFPPVPTKFLFQDSVMSYEKVIYYLARLTLGEACSLISVLGSDSGLQLESRNVISEKHNTPKKREEFFSNIADSFIARLRKLQSNFLRMEGGSSIVDFRMECQDVERGSIINRFARFHGRGPADGIEGSSAAETAPRRSLPQRNVTRLPMPRNLPDGVLLLSL